MLNKNTQKELLQNNTHRKTASLSLEAALIMPVFIYATMLIINVVLFIGLQIRIQLSLYNTALSLSKYDYAYEVIKSEKGINLEELKADSLLTTIIGRGIESGIVKTMVVADLGVDYLEKSDVVGGVRGLYFTQSEILNENGDIDLIVNYKVRSPFDIFGIGAIHIEQRAKIRAFSGDKNIEKPKTEYVYVAPTGSVYHRYTSCKYLNVSVKKVLLAQVDKERNKDGGKYYKCKKCTNKALPGIEVYITAYGNRYHSNRNCSELKRGILRIPKSEVGKRKACSNCGGIYFDGTVGCIDFNDNEYRGYKEEEHNRNRTTDNICYGTGWMCCWKNTVAGDSVGNNSGSGVLRACCFDSRKYWKG